MAFTVREFHDLVEILQVEPAWREELRRLILTDDILTMPQLVRELVELNRQNQPRFVRYDNDISELKSDVKVLKEDTSQLKVDVSQLKVDVSQLKVDVSQLKVDVSQLKVDVSDLKDDVGYLKGRDLERDFGDKPYVYFSRLARKLRVITDADKAELLESALDAGRITEAEEEDIKRLDGLAKGRLKSSGEEGYLAIEVSSVIDIHDVERAQRRAQVLRKAVEKPVLPVVAGQDILQSARSMAEATGVAWVLKQE